MKSNAFAHTWLALIVGGAVGVGFVVNTPSAAFEPAFLGAWKAKYPTSTLPARMMVLTGSECTVCHSPGLFAGAGTCYKNSITAQLNLGMTIQNALNAVDGMDSDGDGAPNGVEILTRRRDNPLHRGYHAGLIGPTGTNACGSNPTQVVTNQLETPPCYADCNLDGALTVGDFGCFQTSFVAGNLYADCNDDGVLTVADFGCFQTKFVAGCP